MKKILLSLAILSCFFVQAQIQITINSSDMPFVNDTVRFSTSNSNVSQNSLDTAIGANKTWDFSGLVPNFQDIASFKAPAAINLNYYTSFGSSTYGTQEANVTLGTTTATDVYSFFNNNSGSFLCTGRGFSISGNPMPQTYNGDVIYKFPLSYGNIDSSNYASITVSLGTYSLTSGGKRVNTVDGWGSLTTPYGTFNCIRIKSVFHGYDSLKIGVTGIAVPRNFIEYSWLAKTRKIPVLSIRINSGTGATTAIKYLDTYRPSVFAQFANFSANKTTVLANSTDTLILTDSSSHNPNSVKWTLSPKTFIFVGGTDSTTKQAKIFFTAPGNYTVTLKAIYNGGNDDTTRSNYISAQQKPVVKFGSNIRTTNVGTNVSFYDSSTCFPTPPTWLWSFTPNKVTYKTGTATAKNIVVTFDSATSYSVTLRVTNAAGSDSLTKNNYVSVYNVGIKEAITDHAPVTIYPNPADGYFELMASRNSVDHIEVYDITGKAHQLNYKWKDQNSCTFDCSQLNAGVYFVKIFFNDKQTSVKKISVR